MNEALIRAIAVDLDDTLLRSDGAVSARTATSLAQWRQAGGHVLVATGRPPRSILPALPELLHDVPLVCYNGAEVRLGGATAYADLIPAADACAIVTRAQTELTGYAVGLEIDDTIYLNRAPDRPKQYVYATDLSEVATAPAAKILFFPTGDSRQMREDHAQLEQLLATLPATTRVMRSNRFRLVQIMSCTADKVNAIQFVLARWGLDLCHLAAFGDDVNDVEMVRQAGLGVAVANAVPEVLAVANHVTETNDEDGVAAVIDALLDPHAVARFA